MSYKVGCGAGYCIKCGDCLDEDEKKRLVEGYCLDCGAKVPAGANVCPHCFEYQFNLKALGLAPGQGDGR